MDIHGRFALFCEEKRGDVEGEAKRKGWGTGLREEGEREGGKTVWEIN